MARSALVRGSRHLLEAERTKKEKNYTINEKVVGPCERTEFGCGGNMQSPGGLEFRQGEL